MFKKFNNNLNNSHVGKIWGVSLTTLLVCLIELALPEEGINSIIPKTELVIMFLSFATIVNFLIATYILIKGEIKQVNVTYVCPTARKYLSEQEIKEIETKEVK